MNYQNLEKLKIQKNTRKKIDERVKYKKTVKKLLAEFIECKYVNGEMVSTYLETVRCSDSKPNTMQ